MIELLNIDCMEYMAGVEDNAFDLAIVDPPYGSDNINGGYTSNKRSKRGAARPKLYNLSLWKHKAPGEEYFIELLRVSRNQIIWGANHFISKIPFDSSCWLVWDKQNENTGFADCELAYTSLKSAVRKFSFRWNGMLQGNMKEKETRIHPTQKPVRLYKWLLESYAKPEQRILDTHLGSGSSAIAAHYFGCDFVGCELDKDYFEAARDRFDKQTSQTALF
jgi:site-specific DNA-methyltransferase (adenine-specific)